ncbi:hypothetical protein C100_14775 [Sphingobium sp. C100]|jgi:hypothetical protein|uniref:hypothetical protein n=1 Tax=Sphingobium sp. C100 TaxID=1207055 RepID=UPI0003D65072|nr:hypothetical protein [Sphingobium sp. C100]ETI63045.1 hypothetical protein C100_14775 [Sphingobium sp. C100]PHQ63958.1 MAG: hypothetical protein COC10_03320 [Sphingobium sp.]
MSVRHSARLMVGLALASLTFPAVAKDKPDPYVAKGEPVDCIQIRSIRSTDVRDDSTIDFIMNNKKIYRNSLPNSCPSLGFEKRFSYRTSLSQLCSVDIITVLWSGGPGLQPGASCGLGKFQPMEKPAK